MIIHKFGGTSVGSAGRFASVADIVIEHHVRRQHSVPNGSRQEAVVVVSAMSGVTDQLITGAWAAAGRDDRTHRQIKSALLHKHIEVLDSLLNHSPEHMEVGGLIEDRLRDLGRLYDSISVLGELTVRSRDAVTSIGEQLSANILAALLRQRGQPAQAISATKLIVTDGNFGAARPLMPPTRLRLQQRVRPLVEQGIIPVITGYIAATGQGVPTTLGRGGSDFTAAIVGAGLGADEVWIWSDVNGILTADPNIVPQARSLAELSYSEAAELAYYGANVLHPKTIRPVVEANIPLRILNSFQPQHPGTRIVKAPSPNRQRLPAIISTTGLGMIALGSHDDAWTLRMAASALQRLSEAGLDVLMFSQSFSEHSLNLVVREQDQAHCLDVLRASFTGSPAQTWTNSGSIGEPGAQGSVGQLPPGFSLGTREKVATISLVGVPGWNQTGIVSHAFAALGKHGTRVIAVAQAATEYSVSFCIPEDQLAGTVRFLHRELGLEAEARHPA